MLDPAQQLLPLLDLDEALEEGARILGHLLLRLPLHLGRHGREVVTPVLLAPLDEAVQVLLGPATEALR